MTNRRSSPLVRLVLATCLAGGGTAAAQNVCNTFPVRDLPAEEYAFSSAFDGTNYCLAISGGAGGTFRGAQRVSPAGLPVGRLLTAGFTGAANPGESTPAIAYGGGQYLLVGSDASGDIQAQFFTTAGAPGAVLPISVDSRPETVAAVGYDGNSFLVVFVREVAPVAEHTAVFGRFVSAAGTLGAEFRISTGLGGHCLNGLSFDGTQFLVAWIEEPIDTAVRGRFVSPAAVLGTEFVIRQSSSVCDTGRVPVVFDGANHLVVWADEVGGLGTATWDVYAQRVSPAGALVGGVVPVAVQPGGQVLPDAAFDGTNTLVTWHDSTNDVDLDQVCDPGESTCMDIHGRFVAPTGALVGSAFPIESGPGNQAGARAAFGAGKFLVTWTDGYASGGVVSDGLRGAFVNPDGCPAMAPYCFGDGTAAPCPCGNAGASGHGCANSVFASGGRLIGSGLPSVAGDGVVLTGSSMPSSSALYFQGTTTSSTAFGDGLRCAGGSVIRLGTKLNDASGASAYPSAPGDLAVSVRGLVPPSGGTRRYQIWYRNAASFCTPSTFNLTNGLEIAWAA